MSFALSILPTRPPLLLTRSPSPSVQKKTRKFAETKRVIGKRDARRRENAQKGEEKNPQNPKGKAKAELVREVPQMPSSMFFQANAALVPPYNVLVDTNFLSHTVQRKLPLLETLMDLLYAKCNPIITDCVMAELEKLGPKYRLALRIARDPRWERLTCDHKGVYADDCLSPRTPSLLPQGRRPPTFCANADRSPPPNPGIVDRVMKHRVYLVATNDKALKQRIRRIPGVSTRFSPRASCSTRGTIFRVWLTHPIGAPRVCGPWKIRHREVCRPRAWPSPLDPC